MKTFLISILFSCFAAALSSAFYALAPGSGGSALSASSLGHRTYKTVPAIKTTYVYSDGSPVSSTSIGKESVNDYSFGYGIGTGVGSGLGIGLGSGLEKSSKSEIGTSALLGPGSTDGASAGLRGPYGFGGRGYGGSPYDRYDPYDSYDDVDPYRQPRSPGLAKSGYHLGYKLGHGVGYGLGYGLGQGIGRGLNTGLDGGNNGDDENGGGGGGRKKGGRSGKLKKEDKKSVEKEDE